MHEVRSTSFEVEHEQAHRRKSTNQYREVPNSKCLELREPALDRRTWTESCRSFEIGYCVTEQSALNATQRPLICAWFSSQGRAPGRV